eukprot:384133-Amphidinium_carterae.1
MIGQSSTVYPGACDRQWPVQWDKQPGTTCNLRQTAEAKVARHRRSPLVHTQQRRLRPSTVLLAAFASHSGPTVAVCYSWNPLVKVPDFSGRGVVLDLW